MFGHAVCKRYTLGHARILPWDISTLGLHLNPFEASGKTIILTPHINSDGPAPRISTIVLALFVFRRTVS